MHLFKFIKYSCVICRYISHKIRRTSFRWHLPLKRNHYWWLCISFSTIPRTETVSDGVPCIFSSFAYRNTTLRTQDFWNNIDAPIIFN